MATPYFYLKRILLTNAIFNTGIRMEGVCAEDFSIVTKHPFVKAAVQKEPYPTEDEIDQFMRAHGFRLVQDATTQWFRVDGRILVVDTRSRNFIKAPPVANDPYGLVPIDVIVSEEPEDVEIQTG